MLLLQCAQTGDFLQATVGRVIEIRAERDASGDMMQAAEHMILAHDMRPIVFRSWLQEMLACRIDRSMRRMQYLAIESPIHNL